MRLMNVTLDGCCDHCQVVEDDELHHWVTPLFSGASALLFGRVTYELLHGTQRPLIMDIRVGAEADDPILVQHYLALWHSYGTHADQYNVEAEEIVQTFINEGRSRLGLATFLAEVDGEVAGSAAGQLQISPYPNVIKAAYRRFGYIWHVFVRPEFERRGIGRALTQAAVDHLRGLDCTSVVLNASDAGEPLYASMGFEQAKEMRLKL
jgi:GNAT superfamily N-acetyltransferase